MRQGLERLLKRNLVAFADEIRGRGRPRRVWSLTSQAASIFPDTHAQLTVDLIGTIRDELGERAFDRLLQRRAKDIAETYKQRVPKKASIETKLERLAELRSAEGYMARLESSPGQSFLLIEDHCPICAAAIACQGFCAVELRVFQSLLGPDWLIERQDHLVSGARRCTYRVSAASKVGS